MLAETVIGDRKIIRSHTVIYDGSFIGNDFATGHGALIREECRIGDNVSVGTHSVIEHHVTIGDNVRIHSNCFVPEYTVIEQGCRLAPGVVLTSTKRPLNSTVKDEIRGSVLRRNCYIGAGAVILAGITIGENAMVGAGAVVTCDVSPGVVVIGSPARFLRTITDRERKS